MKTRRALSLVLVMAMVLSMFTMVLPAGAAPSGMRSVSATRSRTNYTCYTDEQLMEILDLSDISELNTLRSAAYDAVMQNTKWDLSAYNYNWDNSSHQAALLSLIFEHPECFFINNIGGAVYEGSRIAYLTPKYKDGYEVAMEQHAALEAAAQEIMCRFQRTELSDLELAVLIHDYLAANYDYHIATLALSDEERLTLGKFSAYDLLVEGSAVCQGYAEAYAYLMMQFGINCGLCQSDTLNHAWNILELNGKEYHLDVTWDDPTVDTYIEDVTWAEPTSDVYGNVTHTNMLLSTVALQSNHNANDFSGTPANTEFDTAFWQGINSSFCLVGDTIYFINSNQKLCTWDHVDTNKENGDESAYEIVELMDLSATWYATNTGVWPRYFGRLSTDGERLFYSTPNEIYEYFPATNTSKSVYKVEDKIDEASGYKYNIFGFHFDGDNFLLNYYYTPNFNASNVAESVHIYDYPVNASETHVYGDPVYITFPCETDGEVRYDCIYCGFSKFETIPVAGHSEETVPGKAPTCTEDGLTDGAVCSVCGKTTLKQEPIPAPGHTDKTVPGKAATCTEDGLTDGAVCSVCGETTLKQEPIPAPGHDWLAATCTEPVKCSVCGEQQEGETGYILQDPTTYVPQDDDQVVIAVNNNGTYIAMTTGTTGKLDGANLTIVDGKITSDAPPVWVIKTTDNGLALMTNGKYLTRGSSTNFSSATTAYEWILTTTADGYQLTANSDSERQVTYQTSGNRFGPYSNTNASGYIFDLQFFKYVEGGGALGHTEEKIPGTPATCTQDGMTDGSKCSVCGEIIKEQEVIPSTGHTEETVPGTPATCTESGLTDGIKCSICEEVIKAQETIPATGHTEKQVEGSEPTCTQPGMSAGIICATCGISLSDQEITPALGHDYKYASTNDGSHTVTCTRCDLNETAECTYTNTDDVCDFCGYEKPVLNVVTYKCVTDLKNIKAGKYIVGAVRSGKYPSIYPATSKISSGDWVVSSTPFTAVDDSITADLLPSDAQVIVLSGDNTNGFTVGYEENGEMKYLGYTAASNRKLAFDGKYSSILWTVIADPDGGVALSAVSGKYTVSQNSTGTGAIRGYANSTVYTGIYLFAEVAAGSSTCPHANTEVLPGKAATCTESGLTEGSKCADCGEILTKQETIPAIGHNYVDGTCTNCHQEDPRENYSLTSKLKDGDKVIIYNAGNGKAVTYTKSGSYVVGADIAPVENVITTDDLSIVWTVKVNEDGTYTFTNGDYVLGADLNGSYTNLYTDAGHPNTWSLTDCGSGNNSFFVCLTSEDLTPKYEHIYLEWYPKQNAFTAYDTTESKATEADYGFQFYTIGGTVACAHNWDDGIVTTKPTCTTTGVITYTCSLCEETRVETLPASEHAWVAGTPVDPTCTVDGYTPYTCPDCGSEKSEPIPATGHSYEAGKVVAPTCTEDGYTIYTCSGCGGEEHRDPVAATGHTWIPATCTTAAYCENCDEPGGAFIAVDSLSDLVAGSQIVIAAKVGNEYLTLTTSLSSGKFVPYGATGSKTHVNVTDNLPVWTLGQSGESFTLKAANGYLAYKSSTDFKFANEESEWIITKSDRGFHIVSKGTPTRGILYFTDTGKFGAYAISNDGTEGYYYDLMIFKYVEDAVLPHYDNSTPIDNLCDECGCFVEPAVLTSRSISLNGNIAVNFYMSLCDEVSADPNAYMLFTQEGKEGEVKVYMKDCVEKQVRGKEAYVFSYEVAAKEMTDTITAQFFYGEGLSTEEYTYSVKQYADNQHANMPDNEALMQLLDAMLHYGAASQIHFGYNVDRLANEGMEAVDYSTVSITGYDLPTDRGTELVAFVGASLILESETTVRFFFTAKAGAENFTVTHNGTPLKVEYRSGLYYVDVENISAQNLDTTYVLTIDDGVQEADVSYSPLTYCQSVRSKETTTEALANLCGALYLYNQAANIVFDRAE